MRPFALATLALLSVAPAQADAQGRSAPAGEKRQEQKSRRPATTDSTVSIPPGMMPPAGKCRIWMRGVPPAQQPAPTDCTTALRQTPANGVLVFGPALRDLSPFDVRNSSWTAASSATSRQRTRGRRDSSGSSADPSAAPPPVVAPAKTAAVREAKATTRSAPAVREAPPPPKEPPPPTKKPE